VRPKVQSYIVERFRVGQQIFIVDGTAYKREKEAPRKSKRLMETRIEPENCLLTMMGQPVEPVVAMVLFQRVGDCEYSLVPLFVHVPVARASRE
jgi:hypothetical protein